MAPRPGDAVGPLHSPSFRLLSLDDPTYALVAGRVFDMCDDFEACEALTLKPHRTGEALPLAGYFELRRGLSPPLRRERPARGHHRRDQPDPIQHRSVASLARALRAALPDRQHHHLGRRRPHRPRPVTGFPRNLGGAVSLRRVPRRSHVAWWLCCVAVGCSAVPIQESASPLASASAVTAAATTAVPIGDPDRTDAEDERTVSEAVALAAARSHSAMSVAPFGDSDLWLGAGPAPTGLQRALGSGDRPGPLLAGVLAGLRPADFRIVDMCQRPEVVAAWEAAGGPGALVPQFGMYSWERQDVMEQVGRCTSDSAVCFAVHKHWPGNTWGHPELPGFLVVREERCERLWRFVVVSDRRDYRGHQLLFSTLSQVEQWVGDEVRNAALAERESMGQPSNTWVYGFHDSVRRSFGGGPFGITFAPRDAPVDEVQVMVESVAVHGGVLRGLVRNRSRHLWAYGVTVTAGGKEFRWPLSIQPGEVAPFEIPGWNGSEDPGQIQIRIDAETTWHTDPSRAWKVRPSSGRAEVDVGDLTRRPLRDSVRERYAHVVADVEAGSVSVGSVPLEASLEAPESHPSLRDFYEDVAIGDLRGYGAVLDGHGRVVDVVPAPAVVRTEWDEARVEFLRYEEVSSLPHPLVVQQHWSHPAANVRVLFDIHAIHEGLAVDGYDIGKPGGKLTTNVRYNDEHVVVGGIPVDWRYGVLHGGFITWVGAAYPESDLGGP